MITGSSEICVRKRAKSTIENEADAWLFQHGKRNERKESYPIITRDRYRGIRRKEVASFEQITEATA